MDMYFWHFSVFTMQLLIGLVVALVAVELWRLRSPAPRQRDRGHRRRAGAGGGGPASPSAR